MVETRYTHLTHSLLVDAPDNDFELTWEINDATSKLDAFAKSLDLGFCAKTWVTGFCYFDYGNTQPHLTYEEYKNGNRKVYLGVTRHYEIV